MSSGLKKKKIQTKSSIEKRYDAICALYGTKFDEKLKEPTYGILLTMLEERSLSSSSVTAFLKIPTVPITGELSDVFPTPNVPTKVYRISGLVGGRSFDKEMVAFVPNRANSLIYALDPYFQTIHTFGRHEPIFMHILSEDSLPYDMRKWSQSLTSLYLRTVYAGAKVSNVSDLTRTREILNSDIHNKQTLIQIRKINPNVSLKQHKKIDLEKVGQLKRSHALSSHIKSLYTNEAAVNAFLPSPPEDDYDEDHVEDNDLV